MSADLPRLTADAVSAFGEAGLAHGLMGGCARNVYAEPRATKDVDFVVEVLWEMRGRLDRLRRELDA